MESLAAEAARQSGTEGEEDLDRKVEEALACPCVADLREGPCGKPFVDAFSCYVKSTAEDKGSDCMQSFVAMQQCMLAHPDAFAEYAEPANGEATAAGAAAGDASSKGSVKSASSQ
ncbi:hypothetical protein WJX84_001049 [Apatococcus fuscideae]|uniref:Mitochondrial intermembrane space import and assembly protein 40 homolog n=1 Tax=Apatococcus fuscideae TaxID=2026836 RepID=A0AAW1T6A4_9CHLO